MIVDLSYRFALCFDRLVRGHAYSLRLRPRTTPFARVRSCALSLTGNTQGTDGFGNIVDFGYIDRPHALFEVTLDACIELNGRYRCDDAYPHPFVLPTAATAPTLGLRTLFEEFALPAYDMHALTSAIYGHFSYKKGVTSATCSYETMLHAGSGVCQDFAHLWIALWRLQGGSARYVSGFIEGDGESHAWVEAWDGARWVGLDPTNNLLIDDQPYIKIAHGRDAADCAINRGTFRGPVASQTMDIHVSLRSQQ